MKNFFLLFVVLLCLGYAFAHQPRLVFEQAVGEIIDVQNPEISQAFYGILSGQKDVYKIVADTGLLLYVNILVPKIPNQRTDFIVDVIEENTVMFTRLDGKAFVRKDFFEPFGGDTYLHGPSLEKQVGPGTYTIRISNPGNQGKYSLAIGKIESFNLKETINTYKVMPILKTDFFGKPRYTFIRNIIGMFLLGSLVILFLIIYGIIKLVKYFRNR